MNKFKRLEGEYMLEIPHQDTETDIAGLSLCGKQITEVVAVRRTHKLTSYYDHPENYPKLLIGKTIEKISHIRGITHIKAGSTILIFSDGVRLKHFNNGIKTSPEHPFLLFFGDGSCLAAFIDVFGAIWCYKEEELIHPYFGMNAPEF